MLEALLNHFRSYGMDDLEFIIVNSKLSHSQEKFHELQKRVSFGVYQETDEEEVWSVMEGGKDDMFVYDRCGRLTYFVPFPLSILNESPLVSNAILATYFRSPCGVTCERNDTIEFDDIVKNLENEPENVTIVTEDGPDFVETEQSTFVNYTNENGSSNDLLTVINSEIQLENFTSSDTVNMTDYDYSPYNETDYDKDTNNNTVGEATSYFNNLYRLFFNPFHHSHSESNVKTNNTLNETLSNEQQIQTENSTLLNHTLHVQHVHDHEVENSTLHNHTLHVHEHEVKNTALHNYTLHVQHQHNHKVENSTLHNQTLHLHKQHDHKVIQKPKKKSDRCVEADYSVCKSWSKKRLLHAQKCCSPETQIPTDVHDQRSCQNFGNKRCKKIQSILKCCIKTLYSEVTTTTTTTTATPVVEEITVRTEIADAVCCKNTEEGKVCRVSETGLCQDDEYVQDSPDATKCTNLP